MSERAVSYGTGDDVGMTLPSGSLSVNVTVATAAVPSANDVPLAYMTTPVPLAGTAPMETLTANGVPSTTACIAVPLPRSVPLPFAPSYSDAVKVSLPTGADRAIEHVRFVGPAVHRGEPDATFTYCAAPPLIAMPTDTADGETNWVCRARAALAPVAMVGITKVATPLTKLVTEVAVGADVTPPPQPTAVASTTTATPENAVVRRNLTAFADLQGARGTT